MYYWFFFIFDRYKKTRSMLNGSICYFNLRFQFRILLDIRSQVTFTVYLHNQYWKSLEFLTKISEEFPCDYQGGSIESCLTNYTVSSSWKTFWSYHILWRLRKRNKVSAPRKALANEQKCVKLPNWSGSASDVKPNCT